MPPPGEPPILPLMPASLILINGASSAGKTTLCRAVRDAMPAPFLHFSLDFFMFGANVLPRTPEGKIRDWPHLRPHVFQGFNRCLPCWTPGTTSWWTTSLKRPPCGPNSGSFCTAMTCS